MTGGMAPERRFPVRSRVVRWRREEREGEKGPLREREGRESEMTWPSLQRTPSHWQWESVGSHEERSCGFWRAFLKDRRASLSGSPCCNEGVEMVKQKEMKRKKSHFNVAVSMERDDLDFVSPSLYTTKPTSKISFHSNPSERQSEEGPMAGA